MSYMVLILLYLAMAQVDLLTFYTVITEFYLIFTIFVQTGVVSEITALEGSLLIVKILLSGG